MNGFQFSVGTSCEAEGFHSLALTPASTTTAAAGDKIGVAECDDYLAKVDNCVTSKVPAAARAQYTASIEQTRKSWRDLAASPQTRASLASACKQAVESAPAAYKSYGCEFKTRPNPPRG